MSEKPTIEVLLNALLAAAREWHRSIEWEADGDLVRAEAAIVAHVAAIEAQRDAAVAALIDAQPAIRSLPVDALGEGRSVECAPDGECGVMTWPLRDELLDKINTAIAAAEEVTP